MFLILAAVGACVSETPIYTLEGYSSYSKELNRIFKRRHASPALKYSSLFYTKKGLFILTVGCGCEKIQISVSGNSYVLIANSNDSWDSNEKKIYSAQEVNQLVGEVAISKIKELRRVAIKPLVEEPDFHAYVTHDLLRVDVKINGLTRSFEAVTISPLEWTGELPKWLKKYPEK